MHYAIAALVGAILGVTFSIFAARARGRRVTVGVIVCGILGGGLAGALLVTPFGARIVAAGGPRAVAFLAAEGGATSGIGRISENAIDGNPTFERVTEAVVVGGLVEPLGFGGGRLLRLLPPKAKEPLVRLAMRVPETVRNAVGLRDVTLPAPVAAPVVPAPVVLPAPATPGITGALTPMPGG